MIYFVNENIYMTDYNNLLSYFANLNLLETSQLLSHFIVSIILVILLKNWNPYVLTIILSFMLTYIVYNEQTNSEYTYPLIGLFIYLVKVTIELFTDIEKRNLDYQTKELWNLPFWSICSYYIIKISKL